MQRIATVSVILLSLCTNLNGQDGWVWQNPLPQGNDLLNVQLIDQNTGFAVGRHGTLLKTTDGGATWNIQTIEIENPWGDPPTVEVTEDLRCIYFFTRDIGWIVGMGSTILKTTDGGDTWIGQEAPINVDPNDPWAWPDIYHSYAVHFADVNTGWAVGHKSYEEDGYFLTSGSILITTNGGETWIDQPSGTEEWLFDVLTMDATTAWAVGGDWNAAVLLKTTDRGTTWEQQGSPVQTTMHDIYFLDSNIGWIAGTDVVLKTTDGGDSWTSHDISTLGSLHSVAFVDANDGWIAGSSNIDEGCIFKSTDGGENWTECPSGLLYDLNSVSIETTGSGWIVGDYGTILKTNGNGSPWNLQSSARVEHLYSAQFVDNSTGWVVGDNMSIYKTTDGGVNWETQNSGVAHPDWGALYSTCFMDENTGWAVGVNSWPGSSDPILKTTDGGATWNEQATPGDDGLRSVCFVNATTGWTVGFSAGIYHTTDGGTTWNPQDHPFSGTGKTLESVYFVDENKGWIAAGNEGKILHTTDGGANWTEQVSGTIEWLQSIFFIDENRGWTVGGDVTLKTTDGGITWFKQIDDWQYSLESVRFTDANNGYVLGGNDILKTTDGGDTWVAQKRLTDNPLHCVFLANANGVWVVGDGGTILNWTAAQPNTPPTIINLADFAFLNNESYTIDLDSCVTDPDHTPGEMTWQVTPSDTSLKATFSNHHVSFTAPGWGGEADVQFTVTDPEGASDTVAVKAMVFWTTSVHDQKNQIPRTFCLKQNYPNPFNPQTAVDFGLPVSSEVKIAVYNLKGEKVEELFEGRKSAGYHSVIWDASDSPTGTYFIRMEAANFIQVRKCLLLK